jgi:prepilin-type N-terminal cleavage/methylation domain-containing protein
MIKKTLQNKRGFTLVETLVAISILMISVAGPMVLVGNGIRSSAFARDQVTAFYLAQDAIEAMRYIRDGNRIEIVKYTGDPDSLPPWDDLTGFACSEAAPCKVDSLKVYNGEAGGITTADAKTKVLSIDSQGRYGYSPSGEDTVFRRWVTIKPAVGNEAKEVEIVVTVDWSSGIFTRKFSIRENLFYWY